MTSFHGFHPYHHVDVRLLPFNGSIRTITLTTGLSKCFHQYNINILLLRFFTTFLTIIQWWRDVTWKGTYQGLYTLIVIKGLRSDIIIFILSEVLFFYFFWASTEDSHLKQKSIYTYIYICLCIDPLLVSTYLTHFKFLS